MKLQKEDLKGAIEVLIFFVVTMGVLLLFFTFVKFPKTSGPSMNPSFNDGDLMITINTKKVDINDIVVVNSRTLDEYLVKRVIGVGGDHIEIRNSTLYRNGVPLYESYVSTQTWCKESDTLDVIVPEGHIFIMGDNRVNSMDSRAIGSIPVSDIYGRVIFDFTTKTWYID